MSDCAKTPVRVCVKIWNNPGFPATEIIFSKLISVLFTGGKYHRPIGIFQISYRFFLAKGYFIR